MSDQTKANTIVVTVSDAKVSDDSSVILVTHSLGSCIGVCLYDAPTGLAGLLHYQLPTSTLNPDKAREQPHMFADTGLAHLLQLMEGKGAQGKRMTVKLAGGAEMLNDSKLFSIGRRNYTAIRKILWQRGMLIQKEDVGGEAPRTVSLAVADGAVTVKSKGNTYSL
jgi:chemotaxis protein CheD